MHCAPFLLTMQIIFASVSYRRVVADLRIHTLNGRNVFEELKQYFIWNEADLASIIERDGDMIKKSVSMNLRRQELFDDLNRGFTVEDLSNKYLKKTFLQSLLSKIKPLSYRIGVLQLYLKLKKMR